MASHPFGLGERSAPPGHADKCGRETQGSLSHHRFHRRYWPATSCSPGLIRMLSSQSPRHLDPQRCLGTYLVNTEEFLFPQRGLRLTSGLRARAREGVHGTRRSVRVEVGEGKEAAFCTYQEHMGGGDRKLVIFQVGDPSRAVLKRLPRRKSAPALPCHPDFDSVSG